AARYRDEVLPVIEAAGVTLADVQLAWDFTTRSEDNATHDMLQVREIVLGALEEADPEVTVVSVDEEVSDKIWRRIELTVAVPRVVDSDEPGAQLVRDQSGDVMRAGDAEVPFTIWVPRAAEGTAEPLRVLQYGH